MMRKKIRKSSMENVHSNRDTKFLGSEGKEDGVDAYFF